MSPEYVRPYVKAQKNDDRDAEGIAAATTRPTMRFVELKSQDQLDMQTLHRSRDRVVGERTALINQLRAILLERGLVAPQGKWKLKQFLNVLMDEQGGASLSPRMILLVEDARAQWAELDRRIAAFDAEFVRWAKENEEARRLTTIPGIGAIVASALVAAVGRAEDATLGAGAVGMAFDGDEEAFGIIRIDDDRGDLLRVAQAEMRPGFSGVGGLVHAVADGEIRALQTFAAAHVDDVGIAGRDGDGADAPGGLIVKDGIPGVAKVVGFPDAAVDLGHVKDAGLLRDAGDGHGASAAEGADAAPAEVGVESGIELWRWRGLRGSVWQIDGEDRCCDEQDACGEISDGHEFLRRTEEDSAWEVWEQSRCWCASALPVSV